MAWSKENVKSPLPTYNLFYKVFWTILGTIPPGRSLALLNVHFLFVYTLLSSFLVYSYFSPFSFFFFFTDQKPNTAMLCFALTDNCLSHQVLLRNHLQLGLDACGEKGQDEI